MMIIVAGALIGFGLFSAARSLRPVPLADTAATAGTGVGGRPVLSGQLSGQLAGSARRGAARLGLDPARRCATDLAVTGRTPEAHAARALVAGAWLAALDVVVAAVLTAAGLSLHPLVVLAGAALGFVGGPVLAEVVLRSEAASRRDELRADLGAFSELMVLLLAAGSGVEGALVHAAEAGDDWTWQRLREALRAARLTRRSAADALCALGQELGVTELEELGAAVALAASSGTRLRTSLTARAEALRSRELARAQADAASATERMTFPVVALAIGFLVVLGYPALSKVLTGF